MTYTEEWEQIDDYPNYEVSSFGSVRSIKNGNVRLLKPTIDKYSAVSLCKNGVAIRVYIMTH